MKKIVKNIVGSIRDFIKSAKYSRKKQLFLFIILLAFLLIVRNTFLNNKVLDGTPASTRQVELQTITSLAGLGSSLTITGTVESQSEANIRAEGQGQVTRVNNSLGDTVVAGQIIAEIENAFERAQVAQAQASVNSAVASQRETSSLTSIRLENTRTALLKRKYLRSILL